MAGDTSDMEDTYTDDTCHRMFCTVILRVDIHVGVLRVTRRAARGVSPKTKISQPLPFFFSDERKPDAASKINIPAVSF